MSDYFERVYNKMKDLSDNQIEKMLIKAGIKNFESRNEFSIEIKIECDQKNSLNINYPESERYSYYNDNYIKDVA